MKEMFNDAWKRRGSSIVFDQESLGPLIANGHMVSLRAALGWMSAWPATPPVPGRTVLVVGLETMLQVMPPAAAQDFLRQVAKPFILRFQQRCPEHGLVFGFVGSDKSFKTTDDAAEEILYRVPGDQTIRLSFALWDGTSTLDITRLLRQPTGKPVTTLGYHVSRIS